MIRRALMTTSGYVSLGLGLFFAALLLDVVFRFYSDSLTWPVIGSTLGVGVAALGIHKAGALLNERKRDRATGDVELTETTDQGASAESEPNIPLPTRDALRVEVHDALQSVLGRNPVELKPWERNVVTIGALNTLEHALSVSPAPDLEWPEESKGRQDPSSDLQLLIGKVVHIVLESRLAALEGKRGDLSDTAV